ncbi:MAG: helix-turn-helix domain-containing protein [Thermomicrobiales bacterium]
MSESWQPLAGSAPATPHALLPLFPAFLTSRWHGFAGIATTLSRPALLLLRDVAMQPDGAATAESLRPGAPYSTRDPHLPWLAEALQADCLRQDATGRYHLTDCGLALVTRLEREAAAYLAALQPLPAAELTRLAEALTAIAAGLDAGYSGPAGRLAGARQLAALAPDATAPLVQISHAIFDLWMARDDAHIAAWRYARFPGPVLDLLTRLWRGDASTLAELRAVLAATQAPDDVDAGVDELIEQGYVEWRRDVLQPTRAGYAVREYIEADTDEHYFSQWPNLTDADIRWLYDTLQRLIAALVRVERKE